MTAASAKMKYKFETLAISLPVMTLQTNFNPFVPNAFFLYPLKTSENLSFLMFSGVEKGCIGNKWAQQEFWRKSFLELLNVSTFPKTLEWSCLYMKEMRMYFRVQCQTLICFETVQTLSMPKRFCPNK